MPYPGAKAMRGCLRPTLIELIYLRFVSLRVVRTQMLHRVGRILGGPHFPPPRRLSPDTGERRHTCTAHRVYNRVIEEMFDCYRKRHVCFIVCFDTVEIK